MRRAIHAVTAYTRIGHARKGSNYPTLTLQEICISHDRHCFAKARWKKSVCIPASAITQCSGTRSLRQWFPLGCRGHVRDHRPCFGITCIQPEVCPRMLTQMLVACELCAKPRITLKDHVHNANVQQHVDIVPHRRPLCIAYHGRIVVVCRRHIPAHELYADGTNH